MDLNGAYTAYSEYKSKGVWPAAPVFGNLLCLAAGLGDTGSGSEQRSEPPPQDLDKALEIIADMKQNGLELNEASYTSVIRALCTHNKVPESVGMYYEMIDKLKIVPRIRTISMLLHVLAVNQDLAHCEDIFSHIQRFSLAPTEKEYASMLLIYSTLQLDNKFLDCLSTMCDDILRIGLVSTLDTIQSFFTRHSYAISHSVVNDSNGDICFAENTSDSVRLQSIDLAEESRSLLLSQLETLAINRDAPAQPADHSAAAPSDAAPDAQQAPTAGVSMSIVADVHKRYKPNNKMREQREHNAAVASSLNLHSADKKPQSTVTINERLSTQHCENYHEVSNINEINRTNARLCGKMTGNNQAIRNEIWQDFTNWLEQTRVTYPFNLIIDGANIGYYKQNYANAPLHISYEQIHYVYEIIKRLNEELPDDKKIIPLIILHSRHLSHSLLPNLSVYTDLIATWPIYFTPRHFNDDWFWLYAAIKYRCRVVTNDDMRDHHFQFLSPKYFVRWRENCRIMYEMFSFRSNSTSMTGPLHQNMNIRLTKRSADGNTITHHINSDDRKVKVSLLYPLPYSYRIQHIATDKLDGWFFPPLLTEAEMNAEAGKPCKDEQASGESKADAPPQVEADDEHEEPASKDAKDKEVKVWVCMVKYKEADADDVVSGQKRKLNSS